MTHTIEPINSYGSPPTATRTETAPMNWTTYLTYTAPGLSPADTDALRDTLGAVDLTYDHNDGRLQVTLEVDADTLDQATTAALGTAAAATGLLKPTRLYVLSSVAAAAEMAHPAPIDLDLVGLTEVAGELGVSPQRADKLAASPDFPRPVLQTPTGRLWTRASVRAFKKVWEETKNPRGGRRRRTTITTETN